MWWGSSWSWWWWSCWRRSFSSTSFWVMYDILYNLFISQMIIIKRNPKTRLSCGMCIRSSALDQNQTQSGERTWKVHMYFWDGERLRSKEIVSSCKVVWRILIYIIKFYYLEFHIFTIFHRFSLRQNHHPLKPSYTI